MASVQLPLYLTLPSDASMTLYPKNNAACWTTRLQHPISLHGQWECALVEINYPNTTYNMPEKQLIKVSQITSTSPAKLYIDTIVVPAGIYEAADLIKCINDQAPKKVRWLAPDDPKTESTYQSNEPALECKYIPSERKTRFTFCTDRCSLFFPPASSHLQNMLGFKKEHVGPLDDPLYKKKLTILLKEAKKTQVEIEAIFNDQLKEVAFLTATPETQRWVRATAVSDRCINTFGNQNLFIYANICDMEIIGDTVAPLLRTVSIKANSPFETIVEKFDAPHYVKVSRDYIESIEIVIASDLGENAKFEIGRSLVKLHLRKAGMH